MDDDILRQRRNLIAVSAALILFDFADVEVAKVGILGTDLVVGKPIVVVVFAWVIWAYLLPRYFQYWNREGGSPNREAFRIYVKNAALRYARARNFPAREFGGMLYVFQERISVRVEHRDARVDKPLAVLIPGWIRTWWWRVRALLHVALVTPHFTDHLMPFALAVAAPVVTLCVHAPNWQSWVVGVFGR